MNRLGFIPTMSWVYIRERYERSTYGKFTREVYKGNIYGNHIKELYKVTIRWAKKTRQLSLSLQTPGIEYA